MAGARNVIGGELETCSVNPRTGFFRDGCCNTSGEDTGLHLICCEMTEEFLEFSRSHGNDLSTPNPMYDFPGLQPGDRWCVCALHWKEAAAAGVVAPVVLQATHISMLEFVDLEDLQSRAVEDAE